MRAYRILGSNQKMKKGETGICITGNPVRIEDKNSLDFSYKYLVVLFWNVGYRFYKVMQEV